MPDTALKQSVLEAARARLEATAAELRERINDLHAVTIGDDNAESASQTESTHGSDVELMNSLTEQLEHLRQDIDRLGAIDASERMDHVQYGAVVHTDKKEFLVGASIEEFPVMEHRYLGVTTKAPLIQAMLGKKAGDSVTFNKITYKILEVL
jgi:transcription elongation GreA/GreB family factor